MKTLWKIAKISATAYVVWEIYKRKDIIHKYYKEWQQVVQ
ncbi:hypothetical protein IGI80_002446 [Enterococcus sp. DIV1420a]